MDSFLCSIPATDAEVYECTVVEVRLQSAALKVKPLLTGVEHVLHVAIELELR